MGRLLLGIVGILVICFWIIVGCTCSHIIFIILLYIQVLLRKDRLAIIWSKGTLIAARSVEEHKTRFKISTAEVVSLRFVSHSKEEVANDVQERVHGTASGGCTSKVGDHEAGMVAQASCFVVSLKKKQDMADKLLSPLAQKNGRCIHRP